MWRLVLAGAIMLGAACGDANRPPTPAAPSAPGNPADGSVLNVSAPNLRAPADGATLSALSPVMLTLDNVGGAPAGFLTYEFEISHADGALLAIGKPPASTTASTSHTVTQRLVGGVPLTWRARATSNNLAGPWSASRSFVLRAFAHVRPLPHTGAWGDPIDIGKGPVQLEAWVQMQGLDLDCSDGAEWNLNSPGRASLSPSGLFTPLRTGEVIVTARCEGDEGRRTFEVVEAIWVGELAVETCELTGGIGPACGDPALAVGQRLPLTVMVSGSTGSTLGRLGLYLDKLYSSFVVPVTGTISGDGNISVDGVTRGPSSCTADIGARELRIHTIAGRFTLDLHEFTTPCRPPTVILGTWFVSGRVVNMRR